MGNKIGDAKPLNIQVNRRQKAQELGLPKHHVYGRGGRRGFRNPWDSWVTPTATQAWNNLKWRQEQDQDPCVELAAQHLSDSTSPIHQPHRDAIKVPKNSKQPSFANVADSSPPQATAAQAARLLRVEEPDFSFYDIDTNPTPRAKVTWLGHASMLVQLPPIRPGQEPVRCLFDPIFSMRCSPTQSVGPIRSYPPPCDVKALPRIDVVFISHNHYDHLDYDTIKQIWESSKEVVRFFAPLGNRQWFIDCGIPGDRINELDWWDAAHLTHASLGEFQEDGSLTIWCTPAQHGSGRGGPSDTNATLWASWYIKHQYTQPGDTEPQAYRVFFAGDTGYQFHESPEWPPLPPAFRPEGTPSSPHTTTQGNSDTESKYPPCPAFAEIKTRLGAPDLVLLPIAVGSGYAYLSSFFSWLPKSMSVFPRHSPGLTAANHMPPWDAVTVFKVMTERTEPEHDDDYLTQWSPRRMRTRRSTSTPTSPVDIGEHGGYNSSPGSGSRTPLRGAFSRTLSGRQLRDRMAELALSAEIRETARSSRFRHETGPVAVAMHWGTFVTDPVEVLRTLGQLESACLQQGVTFARSYPVVPAGSSLRTLSPGGSRRGQDKRASVGVDPRQPCFVALNHGQSIYL